MKQLIITLGKNGSVSSEAKGFTGGKCIEKAAFLEKALGKPEKITYKPSYYEQEEENTNIISNGLPSGWCG